MQKNDDYWYLLNWKAVSESWKLFQRHCREDPVDWDAVANEMREIGEKYPTQMCKDMLFAVTDELDRYRNPAVAERERQEKMKHREPEGLEPLPGWEGGTQ
ncbi:MAG: hypothetical protein LIO94_11480 [Clostridiales bacterium]|nr:hypothetical protein [Clostridiales bacterium]